MKSFHFFFFLSAFLAVASFPVAAAEGRPSFRILLQWLPQAQFAGFYMAEADGLYRSAGLDVKLLHATTSMDAFAELSAGRCDFASGWLANALLDVSKGMDLVSVAQFHQGTSLAIVARRAAGINRIEDLNGRKVVVWLSPTSRLPIYRMLDARHVKPSAILPMLSQPDLFFRGAADAMGCLMYSEFHQLLMAGFEPEDFAIFRVSDVFPDLVDDGLYTLRGTYERNPEASRRIREATMAGWLRAFADPPRAIALVKQQMRQANLPFPHERQRLMLEELRSLIARPGNNARLRRSSFDSTLSILGLKPDTVDFTRFVPKEEGVN